MSEQLNNNPEWITRGKTIKQLIKELQTFDNLDLEVKISIDDGKTYKCISLVENLYESDTRFCGLANCE